jgi:tetratricopeptide (TPR) repeat protein
MADFYYYRSKQVSRRGSAVEEALNSIERSLFFNPLNSQYHYQKYYLIKNYFKDYKPPIVKNNLTPQDKILLKQAIASLKKAIQLEPSNPSHHIFYALALVKFYGLRDYRIIEIVKKELFRAVELKPYSKVYSRIYQKILDSLKVRKNQL